MASSAGHFKRGEKRKREDEEIGLVSVDINVKVIYDNWTPAQKNENISQQAVQNYKKLFKINPQDPLNRSLFKKLILLLIKLKCISGP